MSKFTLAGLLRLRGMEEDRAAVALGVAAREQAAAEERVRQTADRLAAAELPSAVDGRTWLAAAASRLTLGALLTEDGERATTAQEEALARRAEWTQARQAERAVERLEEHHEERERAEDLRAEQRVLDEAAARGAGESQ
jgi:flagellar FliJ protein